MLQSSSEGTNLNLQQNETSNYASAESSPNPSLISSSSSQSLRSNTSFNGDDTSKSKLSQSISIASLLGNNTNKSLSKHPSMDDPSIVISNNPSHPLADLTGPTNVKLVPVSTSSNALDKLLKQDFCSLGPEFQSLPPNILMNNAKQANEIEKDLLNDSFKQKTESQTIHDLVKTTVTSLIETTVKTSIEEMTKEIQQEKEKNLAAKLMPSLFSPTNSVSSSSPNPATSPFKFLLQDGNKNEAHKSPSQQAKMASTLSPNGSTIQEAVSLFNAEQSKLNDSVIEKLAKLNHKEHEKEDPILSASSSSMNVKDSSKSNLIPGITPSNSQIINPLISQSTSTHSMTVPASSQEFCMNLNMNLVAAANSTSKVPAANGENVAENQRFTSNASTSSIHNDLKMILEGNSTSPNQPKEGDKKEDAQKGESPKPQREKLNRSKNSKTKNEKSEKTEKSNDEITKLVTMMKQMAENKGKPGMQIGSDESGRYRYTKEFLQQIRTERSSFIENISPEIFKAYCYCMSGKYWDPEKYFDIVQYSGDYERVVQQNQQQQQLNAKNMNNKKNVKNDKKTKVAKNFKNVQNDANNNIKENIMSLMKMNNGKQADKVLLDLLKKNQETKSKEEPKQVNLMDMLNKKPKNGNILGELFNKNSSSQTGPKHRPVILTAQELELSQINRPVNRLFTALNQTPDLANKVKSPNSCGSNSCTSECSSASSDMANNTEAYKQLIKNLSNHPLCTPSAARGSSLENVLSKLQQKKNDSQTNVAKDGTNLLKQLLHLKPEQADEQDKKQKNKRNHQHRHHKSSKNDDKQVITSVESTVTTTTTTTITQTQFPLVNPHEKPFQNLKTDKPNNQLENLFNKMKLSNNDKPVENKTEKDHFNSLLNKIMPVSNSAETCSKPKQQQQQQVKQERENILKWFGGLNNVTQHQQQQQQTNNKPNFSARTLTEIELMSGHFP